MNRLLSLSAICLVLSVSYAWAQTQPPVPPAQPPAGSAATAKSPAEHILPTAQKQNPAAPTVQPSKQPKKNLPAAPTSQPKIIEQPSANEGLGSIQTQIRPLPLAPTPEIKIPPRTVKTEDPNKPYMPPELREKSNPDTSMMLPPLYRWERIVLHDLTMPDSDLIISSCKMEKDFIFTRLRDRLRQGQIPVVSVAENANLTYQEVLPEAFPTIVSMEDLVINCMSWVQFQVTADVTFRVPPLMYRRKMKLLLWHDGMLVTSAKSTHNAALINAFSELAIRFRNAWDDQHALIPKDFVIE